MLETAVRDRRRAREAGVPRDPRQPREELVLPFGSAVFDEVSAHQRGAAPEAPSPVSAMSRPGGGRNRPAGTPGWASAAVPHPQTGVCELWRTLAHLTASD